MTNPLTFVSRQSLDAAAARLETPKFYEPMNPVNPINKKNDELYVDGNPNKGFKWTAIAKYGVIAISQEDLFARAEFSGMTNGRKIIYANELGWKYNVDTGMWNRIRGH